MITVHESRIITPRNYDNNYTQQDCNNCNIQKRGQKSERLKWKIIITEYYSKPKTNENDNRQKLEHQEKRK
jgi:hypothetical protein